MTPQQISALAALISTAVFTIEEVVAMVQGHAKNQAAQSIPPTSNPSPHIDALNQLFPSATPD